MKLDITIDGPVFYCPEDEDRFFFLLNSLPGIVEIKGKGRCLHLAFADEVTDEAVIGLLVVCKRWFIKIDSLVVLKNETNGKCPLWHN